MDKRQETAPQIPQRLWHEWREAPVKTTCALVVAASAVLGALTMYSTHLPAIVSATMLLFFPIGAIVIAVIWLIHYAIGREMSVFFGLSRSYCYHLPCCIRISQ